MTSRKHYKIAATMVRSILVGDWTFDTPAWAGPTLQPITIRTDTQDPIYRYTRAVWTAEFLVLLFTADNPRFNGRRFLQDCGLGE